MGKLSQLLGLGKKPSPSSSTAHPIPSLATELVPPPSPWQGNLPCVHGPNDGCNKHNPSRQAIFFDPLLLSSATDNNNNSRKKLKPSGNHPPDPIPGDANYEYITTELTIPTLPQTHPSGCLTPLLPQVHKSVPYSLAFYHVHLAMSADAKLNPRRMLACAASTGRNPVLSWSIRPLVSPSPSPSGPSPSSSSPSPSPSGMKEGGDKRTLLLEYSLAFSVQADLGSWDTTAHGKAVAKEVLIGSGYRDFLPCAHVRVAFKSHRAEGRRDGVRLASVKYVIATTKMVGGEKRGRSKNRKSKGSGDRILVLWVVLVIPIPTSGKREEEKEKKKKKKERTTKVRKRVKSFAAVPGATRTYTYGSEPTGRRSWSACRCTRTWVAGSTLPIRSGWRSFVAGWMFVTEGRGISGGCGGGLLRFDG